jgi:hypothetical protein
MWGSWTLVMKKKNKIKNETNVTMSKNESESETFITKSLKALPLSQNSFDCAPHTKREEMFENVTYVITSLEIEVVTGFLEVGIVIESLNQEQQDNPRLCMLMKHK